MANVLLTFTHPNPASLNGTIADKLEKALTDQGHAVRRNDVYQKNFDCCLSMRDFEAWGKGEVPDDVKREQEDITWADTLAFIYPIWWNERPAKLKGWCDRVLTRPFAWDMGAQGLIPKLTDKKGFVAVTYGSPDALYDHLTIDQSVIRQPMEKGTLNFCGITDVHYVEEYGVLAQDREANEKYIERVLSEAKSFFG